MPKADVRELWGKGYVYPKRIYSTGGAMYDLGKYVGKSLQSSPYDLSQVKRAWGTSRNITGVKSDWCRVGYYSEPYVYDFNLSNLEQENVRVRESRNGLVKYLYEKHT